MSDSTKLHFVDDLHLKSHTPNYLASTLEKQAAAGAALPAHLAHQLAYLQSCTHALQHAWHALLPPEILQDCQVAYADAHRLTVSLSSATAANHLRYLSQSCLHALRSHDERFCQLEELRVIITAKTPTSDARQTSSKKTLSENTKRIITQTATAVITHDGLKSALLRLAGDNE